MSNEAKKEFEKAAAAMQRNNGTFRPEVSVINSHGKVVYGWIDYEVVYNPDFKWPVELRQDTDSWVEADEIVTA